MNERDLIREYCLRIGSDPLLVQGAGGNVSWKDGDTLWIKASGVWLANAGQEDIFVPVDLKAIQDALLDGNFSDVPKIRCETLLRPSIETLLHALMSQRVVVHLHAIGPLVHLVRHDSEAEIGRMLPHTWRWAYVNYQKPGEALAIAVADVLERAPDTDLILLENHGIVVGGADVQEVNLRLSQLISCLNEDPVFNITESVLPEPLVLDGHINYMPVDNADVHNLAIPYLFDRLESSWALYPDHVVFLGAKPSCYESKEELALDIRCGNMPDMLFLRGRGVYALSPLSAAKQAQLKCYYDVLVREPVNMPLRALNKQQIAELLDWDSEKYRQLLEQ